MIDTTISLSELHNRIVSTFHSQNTGSRPYDELNRILIAYKYAITAGNCHEIAETCEARMRSTSIPIELITAYARLAQLARWREARLQ